MIDYFFRWNSEIAAMADAHRLADYLGIELIGSPPMNPAPPLPPLASLPTPPEDTAGVKYAAAVFRGEGRMQSWTHPWFNWGTHRVLPNVRAWRPSQDSGSPPEHTYLTGWFAIVAWPREVDILLNDNNLAFALNRDWDPNSSPKNLVVKNNIGAVITDVSVSPIFAGSNYPIGGFN